MSNTTASTPFRVLSLGAGVQSSVLALLFEHDPDALATAGYERPDVAIFADTGWEPDYVYEHLNWLEKQVTFEVRRVSAGNIRENLQQGRNPAGEGFVDIPLYVENPDGGDGILRRQCTTHYKIAPINRAVREMLGYEPRQRIPVGSVDMMMGISTDEILRAKPNRLRWITSRFPLIDVGMSRAACRSWFHDFYGDRELPRSACVICPFRGNGEWVELEKREPDSYQDAVRFDAWMRTPSGQAAFKYLDGNPYLHPSRTPLGDAVARVKESRVANPELDLFAEECERLLWRLT